MFFYILLLLSKIYSVVVPRIFMLLEILLINGNVYFFPFSCVPSSKMISSNVPKSDYCFNLHFYIHNLTKIFILKYFLITYF